MNLIMSQDKLVHILQQIIGKLNRSKFLPSKNQMPKTKN